MSKQLKAELLSLLDNSRRSSVYSNNDVMRILINAIINLYPGGDKIVTSEMISDINTRINTGEGFYNKDFSGELVQQELDAQNEMFDDINARLDTLEEAVGKLIKKRQKDKGLTVAGVAAGAAGFTGLSGLSGLSSSLGNDIGSASNGKSALDDELKQAQDELHSATDRATKIAVSKRIKDIKKRKEKVTSSASEQVTTQLEAGKESAATEAAKHAEVARIQAEEAAKQAEETRMAAEKEAKDRLAAAAAEAEKQKRRAEAERKRVEAEAQKARAEAEQKAKEAQAAAEKAKAEAEQKAKEAAAAAEVERQRIENEARLRAEEAQKEAERRAKEAEAAAENARLAAEAEQKRLAKQAEDARIAAEQKAAEVQSVAAASLASGMAIFSAPAASPASASAPTSGSEKKTGGISNTIMNFLGMGDSSDDEFEIPTPATAAAAPPSEPVAAAAAVPAVAAASSSVPPPSSESSAPAELSAQVPSASASVPNDVPPLSKKASLVSQEGLPNESDPLLESRRSSLGWKVQRSNLDNEKNAKLIQRSYEKIHQKWRKEANDSHRANDVITLSQEIGKINPVAEGDIGAALAAAANNPATTFEVNLFLN